jgi:hypothetical protein
MAATTDHQIRAAMTGSPTNSQAPTARVRAARGHCDLRLQHSDQGLLAGVRLVELLHDLLLGGVHTTS